ncbi:MAG: hypothetical protein D6732_20680 [Methanobacteriota archaeon]|nr:MAG: hypothetical protein D6732_20680 [Euryarchaeota archaeon]
MGSFEFSLGEIVIYFLMGVFSYSIFGLAAFLAKKGAPHWIPRKTVHTLGMTIIAIYSVIVQDTGAILFIGGVVVTIALGLNMTRLNFIEWMAKATARENEHWTETVGNLVITTLTLFSLYFYNKFNSPLFPSIYLTAILSLAWGDGLAELVGRKFGRIKYRILGDKTLEGSLTVFLVTFILGFFSFWAFNEITSHVLLALLLASMVASLVEAVAIRVFDNLLIPLSVQLTLWYLLIS